MSGNRPLRGTPADIAAREDANVGCRYGGANISGEESDRRERARDALKEQNLKQKKRAIKEYLSAQDREKELARIIEEEEAEFAKWKKENNGVCNDNNNSQDPEVDDWENL